MEPSVTAAVATSTCRVRRSPTTDHAPSATMAMAPANPQSCDDFHFISSPFPHQSSTVRGHDGFDRGDVPNVRQADETTMNGARGVQRDCQAQVVVPSTAKAIPKRTPEQTNAMP